MVTLSDFNNVEKPTLAELSPVPQVTQAANGQTINNMAAHAALLADPSGVLKTYSSVSAELSTGTSSATLDALLKQNEKAEQTANYEELQNILRDPAIDTATKQQYMDGYIKSVAQPTNRSMSALVGQNASVQPTSDEENDETVATTTFELGATLDGVDSWKGWVNKVQNAQREIVEGNGLNTLVDIFETLVPFMDQASVAKARLTAGGNAGDALKAFVLMGDSKAEWGKTLSKMPIEKRYEFGTKLVEYIKSAKGSVTIRPNELQILNQLSAALSTGTYTGTDQFIDNLTSVMDIVFPASTWLGKAVKGARAAKEAAVIAKRAEAADKSLANAAEVAPVVDEAAPVMLPPSGNILEPALTLRGKTMSETSPLVPNKELAPVVNSITRNLDSPTKKSKTAVKKTMEYIPNKGKTQDEIDKLTDEKFPGKVMSAVKYKGEVFYGEHHPYAIQKVIDKYGEQAREDFRNILKDRGYYSSEDIGFVRFTIQEEKVTSVKQSSDISVMDELDDVMAESTVERLSIRTSVDHTSVSQTLKDTNPAKARNVNAMVEADKTDNTARILTGTSRADAIANDRLPEVALPGGVVRNKVEMDEAGPAADKTVVDSIMKEQGMTHISKEDKAAARTKAKDEWRDVIGLVPRRSMATIGREVDEAADNAQGVSFDMIYGPKDGGFSSAKQGLQQVLVGLKKYGVTGNDVEVLARGVDGLYHPIKGLPTTSGNYLMRVKHDYKFSPADTISKTMFGESNWNLFELLPILGKGDAGSIGEHLIPSSARIDSRLFSSASVASDVNAKINKQLLELGKDYAQSYKRLSKEQKDLFDAYRLEANEKSLRFSVSNLRARGFSNDAVDTMRKWKTITDTMYELENIDVNRTLRLRGWERFVDQSNDTDIVVKNLPNRGFGDGIKVYDTEQNIIRVAGKKEIDELYANGGNVAQTRSQTTVGDDSFNYILVKQKSEGSYTRAINDTDRTLSYRDGYYPVRYTDPIFITKKVTNPNGTSYTKAIATSGTYNDANQLIERLRTTDNSLDADGKSVYEMRPNFRKGSTEYEEAEWSSLVSSGRSTQRIRGQRLESANARTTDMNLTHIESPEESLVHSIRSLAARTAFRDWVETSKAKWMRQYGDLIDKVDGYKSLWPESRTMIAQGKVGDSYRVANAKATWAYIHSMEAGYVNLIDDFSKNFFRSMANVVGEKGWGWLEKGLGSVSEASPLSFARRKAFRLLLASNPLRQLPVQAMQALPVLMATNPLAIPKISMQMIMLDYVKNGGDADSFMKVLAKAATGMNAAQARKLAKDWEASGFEASVEANTLIRDQMGSLVDRTLWDKARGVLRKPLDFTQKIGFNKGEEILMRSIWLSEYDLALKAGKKLDAEGLDELNARVRNLTLNMNKAGELPYNQNALSAALQFFQAPHKAFSQILLGHKGLTGKDRRQLAAAYVLTYGTGAGWVTDMVMDGLAASGLPLDQDAKEVLEGGLFNLAMNAALSTLYKEEVEVDFSDSLRLISAPDFMFWEDLIGSEVSEVLSGSASASLVFGSNPRVTNFVNQMMRPFVVDWEKKPEELMLAGESFLKMFSGASNIFKAMYAVKFERHMTARGRITDYNVNMVEAMAKAAGFATVTEIREFAAQEDFYKASEEYKKDIKLIVDEISMRLANKGISNNEASFYIEAMSMAQVAFENDPFYMKEFANQMRYKALADENSIYLRLREMSGWMDKNEYEKLVQSFPNLEDGHKKTLIDSVRMFGE